VAALLLHPAGASQPQGPSGARVAPHAAGEGSGLIDIRALAKSTTPGTKPAPSQAVDDLLDRYGRSAACSACRARTGTLDSSDGNRWLWIGGAL
jgi:hypothetical protein